MGKDKIYSELRNYALRLLSIRPQSEQELRRRLQMFIKRRKLRSKSYTDELISKLKESNLINDREFTQWFIRSRKRNKPRGKFVIRRELIAKGVKGDLIEEILEKQYKKEEERKIAQKLLDKRISLIKKGEERKMKIKLTKFLLRRGFDKEIVFNIIDEKLVKS